MVLVSRARFFACAVLRLRMTPLSFIAVNHDSLLANASPCLPHFKAGKPNHGLSIGVGYA